MSRVTYEFHINGLPVEGGAISVRALMDLLGSLTECAERGLRLAIEGVSVKTGRTPTWLKRAVDLTFVGLRPGTSTLILEAPTLGGLLGAELSQQDFFMAPPSLDDTALSLVSRSIRDATADQLESDYFDGGTLRSLLGFQAFFRNGATSIDWVVPERPEESLKFGVLEFEKVQRLRERTPPPRTISVSGVLQSIRFRDGRFCLDSPDGHAIPCRVHEGAVTPERLRDLWGRKVTVTGTVYFKPSGCVQLLETHSIALRLPKDHPMASSATLVSMGELFDQPAAAPQVVAAHNHADWSYDLPLEARWTA